MRINQLKMARTVIIIGITSVMSISFATDSTETYMDMDLTDLMNVKVEVASKSEESISDAPGVISVLTKDEIQRFGGTTLGDILKRVPSFLGTTVYMTDRSIIASRGDQVMPSSSHILMLINGRPIREVQEGGIKSDVYESFPVSVIDHIEVIRGPGSVLYGSQAFSAVINVVTKKADENTVSVSGMLGEGLSNNVMADLQYKIGDFGVVLAGRYADKGKWDLTWEAPGLAAIHEVDVEIPDNGPGVFGELSYKNFRLMGSFTQWNHQHFIPDYEFLKDVGAITGDATGESSWKKLFGDLGYQQKINDWYDISANVTYTRSWFENDKDAWPFTARDGYEVIAEVTNFFKPIENLNVIVGGVGGVMSALEKDVNGNEDPATGLSIFNEGHLKQSFSGYAQVDYRKDFYKLIGGVQVNKVRAVDSLDQVDDFDVDVNPRAGLILYPIENINIKLLYSTAYRAPSLNELYLDHSAMRGQMVPRDPSEGISTYGLEPEKVHTFDVGVNYSSKSAQIGINGFHSRMKNLIIQDRNTAHYAIPTWDNLGEVTIFGMECEGKYYVTEEILFEGSFLYQHSKNEDENSDEINVTPLPNFSAKGGLSYISKFGLMVSAFNTFQEQLDPKYESDLNKVTKYFNMVHVHAVYDLNKALSISNVKELSLVLQIDNLLDEEIWLPAWGLTPGSTIPYNRGRIIYGGFKVSF